MKTTVLAIALAFATMPLTFAQNPPAKPVRTDTSKPPKKHDTSKKPTKKGGTSNNTSVNKPAQGSGNAGGASSTTTPTVKK